MRTVSNTEEQGKKKHPAGLQLKNSPADRFRFWLAKLQIRELCWTSSPRAFLNRNYVFLHERFHLCEQQKASVKPFLNTHKICAATHSVPQQPLVTSPRTCVVYTSC